jgi:hypothetical protein
MHSYPTHSISRNQSAVASTGNRWTAILEVPNFHYHQRVIAEPWRASIFAFPNIQCKERRFLPGLKAMVSAPKI